MVKALSLLEFKKCLDNVLRHTVWFFGWSFGDMRVGLNGPCGSLPVQDTLWFYSLLLVLFSTSICWWPLRLCEAEDSSSTVYNCIWGWPTTHSPKRKEDSSNSYKRMSKEYTAKTQNSDSFTAGWPWATCTSKEDKLPKWSTSYKRVISRNCTY